MAEKTDPTQRNGRQALLTRTADRNKNQRRLKFLEREVVGIAPLSGEFYSVEQVAMDFRAKFSTNSAELKSKIVPVFLSMVPGIFGMGALIAAVVIVSWLEKSIVPASSFQAQSVGLFYVCKTQVNDLGTAGGNTETTTCVTREEEAAKGFAIDALEQATRSMMIISIILHLPGIIAAIFFGLRRNVRRRSSFIAGGIFGLAAVCALCGMACYSAFYTKQLNEASSLNYIRTVPGLSYMLGWFGTVCAIIASVTACVSHKIN